MLHSAVDDYSEFLCYCWLGALMHDIGKLSVSFLISKERSSTVPDRHGQIIFSDIERVPPDFMGLITTPLESLCNVPSALKGYCLLYFICSHHGCERCGGDHRCGSAGMADHPLTEILQSADRLESSNPSDLRKQSLLTVKRSDFFGLEYPLHPHRFSGYREKIYGAVARIFCRDRLSVHAKISRASAVLSEYLSRGLSETRKRAHDIDIFSHSHATAVYMKLILTDLLSSGASRGSAQWCELLMEPHYRALEVKAGEEAARRAISLLEYEHPCGALIWDAPGRLCFFVGASVSEERIRDAGISLFILSAPMFSGLPLRGDDSFVFQSPEPLPHTVFLNLKQCAALAGKLSITEPEEIEEGMTVEKLIIGLEQTLAYPDFCTMLALLRKKRSLSKHISHMEKGLMHSSDQGLRKALDSARRRMEETERLEKELSYVERKAGEWDWRCRSDAAETVWSFLSRVLSPVRPPHMAQLARKWKKYTAQGMGFDELAEALILSKQINLSRLFSLQSDTKRLFRRMSKGRRRSMTSLSLTMPDDDVLKLFRESRWREFESSFIFFGGGITDMTGIVTGSAAACPPGMALPGIRMTGKWPGAPAASFPAGPSGAGTARKPPRGSQAPR